MYKQVPVFQAVSYNIQFRNRIREMTLRTFKVPVERNGTHDKANEGEDGIDLVWKSPLAL